MCDIFGKECAHKGCHEVVMMHLGDYKTDREEIKVYCDHHTDKAYHREGINVLFAYNENDRDEEKVTRLRRCCVVPTTINAFLNMASNHPNFWSYEILDIKINPKTLRKLIEVK